MTHTFEVVHSDLTQEEKIQEIDKDRKARGLSTFKDFASAFANETRGGRFAKSDHTSMAKPLPPNSPWAGPNPGPGDEPPLGYDINEVPDLGYPLNKQSIAQAPASSPAVEPATDERRGEPHHPTPSLSSEK
jgi:hypothetical protein